MHRLNFDDGWIELAIIASVFPADTVAVRNAYAPSTAIYRLNDEAIAWLDDNCEGEYKERRGNTLVTVSFTNERDATLFWTFYG